MLKRILQVRLYARRTTAPASMAVTFSSNWTMCHDFWWQEKLQIVKDEWASEGWYVASVDVLKSGSSYQVTLQYEKKCPETGRLDYFTEVLWKSPFSIWKPSSVTLLLYPEATLRIGWWYNEPSRTATLSDRGMRKDLHLDEASASYAMAAAEMENAATPAAPSQEFCPWS